MVKCKALIQSSINSSKEEGIILGNAAKLIRKHLFSNYTLFDEDISEEKQSLLVPPRLLHLLALILDSTTITKYQLEQK